MKRFIVERRGLCRLRRAGDSSLRFLTISAGNWRQWVEAEEESLPGDDSMAWCGGLSDHYVGYDVEIAETDVHDARARRAPRCDERAEGRKFRRDSTSPDCKEKISADLKEIGGATYIVR